MSDASPGQLTRRQLYERIRASSEDEVILAEMKRLGFWPKDESLPSASEDLITRKGALEKELRTLYEHQQLAKNPEAALKKMRKERMAEARQKRIETRQRHEQQRLERAQQWQKRQQQEILYIGPEVSLGLSRRQSNEARLQAAALPILHDAAALATAMGVGLSELRFLCFSRAASTVTHYRRFSLPKKTGGLRLISTPMPRLKRLQYWILENILNPIALHDCAHGFRCGRSILSNAKPHVGKALVVNRDLKDFFPSIAYARIKGIFRALGYSDQVATLLGLLCTESEQDEVVLDGQTYYLSRGERHLPQGAPTSPALSNLLCRRLDRRLQGAAKALSFAYTRYADDLCFSRDKRDNAALKTLLWQTHKIISEEGLQLHPDKTRVMGTGRRQEVTGIVVNRKLSVDRKTLRRFRALLHNIERDGPEGKSWGQGGPLLASILGYAHFVRMVDPRRGNALLQKIGVIHQKQAWTPHHRVPGSLSNRHLRTQAAQAKAPQNSTWQEAQNTPPAMQLPPVETKPTRPTPVDTAPVSYLPLASTDYSARFKKMRVIAYSLLLGIVFFGIYAMNKPPPNKKVVSQAVYYHLLEVATQYKNKVAIFTHHNGRLPSSNQALGLDAKGVPLAVEITEKEPALANDLYVAHVTISNGGVVNLTLKTKETIIWKPSLIKNNPGVTATLSWRCSGYCPAYRPL